MPLDCFLNVIWDESYTLWQGGKRERKGSKACQLKDMQEEQAAVREAGGERTSGRVECSWCTWRYGMEERW